MECQVATNPISRFAAEHARGSMNAFGHEMSGTSYCVLHKC